MALSKLQGQLIDPASGSKGAILEILDIEAAAKLDEEDQGPITGGASITPKSLGSVGTSTLTIDPRDRAYQTVTATGTITFATMEHQGATVLYLTMGSGAGVPVTAGWKFDGDPFTATEGHIFRIHMERVGSIHYMSSRAWQ